MKNALKTLLAAAILTGGATAALAAGGPPHSTLYNPNPAPLSVTNTISEVMGYVGGFIDSEGNVNGDMYNPDNVTIIYPIAGEVYATVTSSTSGETLGSYTQVGNVSATALFSTSFFGLMGDWNQLPATMPWTMDNDFAMNVGGSTFALEEELTGRAFPHLGPVENPMETGTMALRMAGCAGVREISGMGDYAGKVGTLCMNGTFTFDQMFSGKGVSNCSIALHDPLN